MAYNGGISHSLAIERPRQFSLSCVVPAYNEAHNLTRLIPALAARLAAISDRYEIVLVNDGSTDTTEAIVSQLIGEYPLVYVGLSRNFGKEAALTAGLDATNGDAVIILDADFQHPMELIAPMVEKWHAGSDMVFGVRTSREGESAMKRAGVRFFHRVLSSGTQVTLPVGAGDFRLLDRRVVEALRSLPERNRFMKGLYGWVGFRSEAIEYEVAPRADGDSKFPLRSLARLALTGMTAFSNLPLRISSGIGFVVSLFSIGFGAWLLVEFALFGQPIPGFTTLAVSVLLFAGVQLISIGVLGEYLGRVFDEVKGRPLYIVGNQASSSPLTTAVRASTEVELRQAVR